MESAPTSPESSPTACYAVLSATFFRADASVHARDSPSPAALLADFIPLPPVAPGLPFVATILPSVATALPSVATALPSVATILPPVATALPFDAISLPFDAIGLPPVAPILPSVAIALPFVAPGLPFVAAKLSSYLSTLPRRLVPRSIRVLSPIGDSIAPPSLPSGLPQQLRSRHAAPLPQPLVSPSKKRNFNYFARSGAICRPPPVILEP